MLAYHVKSRHLVRIRKGLYAAAAPGSTAASVPIDPFLVAGKLRRDGKAHSPTHEFFYLTNLGARPLEFRGQQFKAVHPPAALRRKRAELAGVLTAERMGLSVRVTSLERTMVDVPDRPHRLS